MKQAQKIFLPPSSYPTKEADHGLKGKRTADVSGLARREIAPAITTKKKTWSEQKDRRVAVAEYFKQTLGFPQKNLWYGHGGTIAQIKKVYLDMSRNTIDSILMEIFNSEHSGNMYTRERQDCRFFCSYVIEPGSVEEQLLADLMEQGKGY